MACEVAVERALGRAYAAKGLSYIEAAVGAFFNGYNIGGAERMRNFYNALTGRTIHNEPFWQAFKASATRRNKIIHKALIVDIPSIATYARPLCL